MELDQLPQVQPTQIPKPPLGIQIMASLLLLLGLAIGMDVLSSILATIIGGWIFIVLGIIALALFILTERTAIQMYKMKFSKTNYYTIVALDSIYIIAKSSLAIFILAKEMPPIQVLSGTMIGITIMFLIFSLPFFIMTRDDIYNPTPEAKKWGAISSIAIISFIIAGTIYSEISTYQPKEEMIDTIANELLKSMDEKSKQENLTPAVSETDTINLTNDTNSEKIPR